MRPAPAIQPSSGQLAPSSPLFRPASMIGLEQPRSLMSNSSLGGATEPKQSATQSRHQSNLQPAATNSQQLLVQNRRTTDTWTETTARPDLRSLPPSTRIHPSSATRLHTDARVHADARIPPEVRVQPDPRLHPDPSGRLQAAQTETRAYHVPETTPRLHPRVRTDNMRPIQVDSHPLQMEARPLQTEPRGLHSEVRGESQPMGTEPRSLQAQSRLPTEIRSTTDGVQSRSYIDVRRCTYTSRGDKQRPIPDSHTLPADVLILDGGEVSLRSSDIRHVPDMRHAEPRHPSDFRHAPELIRRQEIRYAGGDMRQGAEVRSNGDRWYNRRQTNASFFTMVSPGMVSPVGRATTDLGSQATVIASYPLKPRDLADASRRSTTAALYPRYGSLTSAALNMAPAEVFPAHDFPAPNAGPFAGQPGSFPASFPAGQTGSFPAGGSATATPAATFATAYPAGSYCQPCTSTQPSTGVYASSYGGGYVQAMGMGGNYIQTPQSGYAQSAYGSNAQSGYGSNAPSGYGSNVQSGYGSNVQRVYPGSYLAVTTSPSEAGEPSSLVEKDSTATYLSSLHKIGSAAMSNSSSLIMSSPLRSDQPSHPTERSSFLTERKRRPGPQRPSLRPTIEVLSYANHPEPPKTSRPADISRRPREPPRSTLDHTRLTLDTARPGIDTARPGIDTARPGIDTARATVDSEKRPPIDTARPSVDTARKTVRPVVETSSHDVQRPREVTGGAAVLISPNTARKEVKRLSTEPTTEALFFGQPTAGFDPKPASARKHYNLNERDVKSSSAFKPPPHQRQYPLESGELPCETVVRRLKIVEESSAEMADTPEAKSPKRTDESVTTAASINVKQTPSMSQVRQAEPPQADLRRINSLSSLDTIAMIGQGGYAVVRAVRHREEGTCCALKQIAKSDIGNVSQLRMLLTEVEILCACENWAQSKENAPPLSDARNARRLQVQEIVWRTGVNYMTKHYSSWHDQNFIYFLMEYLPGGDLMKHLIDKEIFPEHTAKVYTAEIAIAIGFMHDYLGFVHRDVKPDNVLFDASGHIKLVDFGLSRSLPSRPPGKRGEFTEAFQSVVGTPDYMAPEVHRQGVSHDRTIDWWSLGIILYEMLFGGPPLSDLQHRPEVTAKLVKNWKSFLTSYPKNPHVSNQAKDLLSKLIADKGDRYQTVEEVLTHPWFDDLDLANLRSTMAPILPEVNGPYDVRNFDTFSASKLTQWEVSKKRRNSIPADVAEALKRCTKLRGPRTENPRTKLEPQELRSPRLSVAITRRPGQMPRQSGGETARHDESRHPDSARHTETTRHAETTRHTDTTKHTDTAKQTETSKNAAIDTVRNTDQEAARRSSKHPESSESAMRHPASSLRTTDGRHNARPADGTRQGDGIRSRDGGRGSSKVGDGARRQAEGYRPSENLRGSECTLQSGASKRSERQGAAVRGAETYRPGMHSAMRAPAYVIRTQGDEPKRGAGTDTSELNMRNEGFPLLAGFKSAVSRWLTVTGGGVGNSTSTVSSGGGSRRPADQPQGDARRLADPVLSGGDARRSADHGGLYYPRAKAGQSVVMVSGIARGTTNGSATQRARGAQKAVQTDPPPSVVRRRDSPLTSRGVAPPRVTEKRSETRIG